MYGKVLFLATNVCDLWSALVGPSTSDATRSSTCILVPTVVLTTLCSVDDG